MGLPWEERVPALSINPDMANRDDVARLAAELMELRAENERLREALDKAATSLETIRDSAGSYELLTEMSQVRGYANSRATVARVALEK